jgi:hypothetical protein
LMSLVFGLFFFPVFSFVKDSCQNWAKRQIHAADLLVWYWGLV